MRAVKVELNRQITSLYGWLVSLLLNPLPWHGLTYEDSALADQFALEVSKHLDNINSLITKKEQEKLAAAISEDLHIPHALLSRTSL